MTITRAVWSFWYDAGLALTGHAVQVYHNNLLLAQNGAEWLYVTAIWL